MSYLELAKQARRDVPEPKEPAREAPAGRRSLPVTDIQTARALRGEDERRLLAAGWSPKERCGPLELTIWANPETGFYCSREVALHRLDSPLPANPYRKVPGNQA